MHINTRLIDSLAPPAVQSPSSPTATPRSRYAAVSTPVNTAERRALDSFSVHLRLEWPKTLVVTPLDQQRYQVGCTA